MLAFLHRLLDSHLDYIVSDISALVYVLMIFKTRLAFVVGLTNQGFWFLFMQLTERHGLLHSIIFFACTNIFGFVWWTLHPPKKGKFRFRRNHEESSEPVFSGRSGTI